MYLKHIGAMLDNNYDTVKEVLFSVIEKYIDFTDIIIKNIDHKEQIIKYLNIIIKKIQNILIKM